MLCLDANALIDYLHGEEGIGKFVTDHETEPLFAPTIALHETFIGAVRARGEAGLEDVQDDLGWVEPIQVTVDGAAEAARIDAELHAGGEPIGALDTLIAGVVRDVDGTVVTRDDHFERVADLDVVRYDQRGEDES